MKKKYSLSSLYLSNQGLFKALIFIFLTISFFIEEVNGQEKEYLYNQDSVYIDPQTELTIDKIFIVGNRRTKEKIILRELSFKEGEIQKKIQLDEAIERDRQKLINTRLFMDVDFSLIDLPENRVDVIIRVTERWYFFPISIFCLQCFFKA